MERRRPKKLIKIAHSGSTAYRRPAVFVRAAWSDRRSCEAADSGHTVWQRLRRGL